MARAAPAANPEIELLELLPRRSAQEFARGSVIYSPDQPSESLFLVAAGRVKVSSTPGEGVTACHLAFKGSLFGEQALIKPAERTDTAVALGASSVLSWTSGEIRERVDFNPRLGVVLCQYMVKQCLELADRVQTLALYNTPERVILALAELAHRSGVGLPDGSTRVETLTHQTLSEYVGTSREVVTFHLTRLRSQGLIRYSRRYMDLSVAKLEAALRRP
jgi:CRP/FNR family cyclic AMP-dependent transcriptional regulator